MPFFINAFHPADAITTTGKLIRLNSTETDACALFNFRFEGFYPYSLQRIFGFSIFAIGSIAPITLSGNNRFSDSQRVL